jgi:phosphate starvation-inducible protein PhoH and related proteins
LVSTSSASSSEFLADPEDNHRLARLCGPLDSNLRAVESQFGVIVSRRGSAIKIEGNAKMRRSALAALQYFYEQAVAPMPDDAIALGLMHMRNRTNAGPVSKGDISPILQTRRSDLQGRTASQRNYIRAILAHDITFGVGPAGTGKTYLAVACAVDAFERDLVKRIVLTRPAVEAGERLGFLPGDMNQKVDPYLRPLYDALYELMGSDRTQKLFERQAIEVAPLAYMRGRTLNHSFVILDEAQNTTPAQMKMFLTRIGFGSKTVVTGDRTQQDLPSGQMSGLLDAERVLKRVKEIAFCEFTSQDVVRHPLIAKIVDAYDKTSKKSQ